MLRGGEYNISDTLCFTSEDGGKNGRKVTWKGYESETPVISGVTELTAGAFMMQIRTYTALLFRRALIPVNYILTAKRRCVQGIYHTQATHIIILNAHVSLV